MSESKRIELIRKIEKIRESKVITYFISDRPNIITQIEESDIRELYEHIKKIKNNEKIDLFIYSLGGDATVPWALVNIIREYTKEFNVLIPFKAFSAATSIAVGANNIIMNKTAFLGPVDPLVANPFNPVIEDRITPISVEDVGGYLSLIKDKFEIKDQINVTKGFEILATEINPLALGNVYRHYLKSRDDVKKLLELHLNSEKEQEKINSIIAILVEKLYYHGHHINRQEAEKIKLPIKKAEDFSSNGENLSDIMWKLFEEYEKDLELKKPYKDELPKQGNINKIPIKYIESSNLSSVKIIEQDFVNLRFQQGTILIFSENKQPGVYIPGTAQSQPQTIPIYCEGKPVVLNNTIYDKREIDYWEIKPIN
ncbi:MAG: hypothetical protein IMZ58_05490 [Thermoplasmata archaeon]|nr:hypothetical protein [Thermoplasmata archaeon]